MPQTATGVGFTHLGRVMVVVSDQDRAIEFYRDKLGFEIRADVPFGDGDRWVEVGLPGSHTAIALVRPQGSAKPGVMTNIALEADDVDATHSELRSRGVDVDKEVARFGDPVPPMFWFRDQDGNTLMVAQPERG